MASSSVRALDFCDVQLSAHQAKSQLVDRLEDRVQRERKEREEKRGGEPNNHPRRPLHPQPVASSPFQPSSVSKIHTKSLHPWPRTRIFTGRNKNAYYWLARREDICHGGHIFRELRVELDNQFNKSTTFGYLVRSPASEDKNVVPLMQMLPRMQMFFVLITCGAQRGSRT